MFQRSQVVDSLSPRIMISASQPFHAETKALPAAAGSQLQLRTHETAPSWAEDGCQRQWIKGVNQGRKADDSARAQGCRASFARDPGVLEGAADANGERVQGVSKGAPLGWGCWGGLRLGGRCAGLKGLVAGDEGPHAVRHLLRDQAVRQQHLRGPAAASSGPGHPSKRASKPLTRQLWATPCNGGVAGRHPSAVSEEPTPKLHCVCCRLQRAHLEDEGEREGGVQGEAVGGHALRAALLPVDEHHHVRHHQALVLRKAELRV